VHRADLQLTLLEHAKRLGAVVRTHAHVDRVDFAVADEPGTFGNQQIGTPRLLVKNRGEGAGEWIDADVVIAADGIRSGTRAAMMEMHGTKDESEGWWVLDGARSC
jgi:2-polyprenyl-6-methoxyphenol hydroxylase-like FAD-dependent oxidoreductase